MDTVWAARVTCVPRTKEAQLTTETAQVAVVIGGDGATRALVQYLLMQVGCAVHAVPTPEALARSSLGTNIALALIVLEPAASDVNILYAVRRLGYRVPTLVLGHDLQLDMRRRALALGAADVVNLPADAHSLLARLQGILVGPQIQSGAERQGPLAAGLVLAGGLVLDTGARVLKAADGQTVQLTRRETALLDAFMHLPGEVVGRQNLLDKVWGVDYKGDISVLEAYIWRLRRKLTQLGVSRRYIHTIPRRGYLFDARAAARPILPMDQQERQRVLVIDDDPAIASMVKEALDEEGYHVVWSLGAEGLMLARQLHPVVILLDLMMPGMDGMEVQRHLKSNPRTTTIPVIAMSAGTNLLAHAKEIDADDYMAKPFGLDELLLRIQKWARDDASAPLPILSGRRGEIS